MEYDPQLTTTTDEQGREHEVVVDSDGNELIVHVGGQHRRTFHLAKTDAIPDPKPVCGTKHKVEPSDRATQIDRVRFGQRKHTKLKRLCKRCESIRDSDTDTNGPGTGAGTPVYQLLNSMSVDEFNSQTTTSQQDNGPEVANQ